MCTRIPERCGTSGQLQDSQDTYQRSSSFGHCPSHRAYCHLEIFRPYQQLHYQPIARARRYWCHKYSWSIPRRLPSHRVVLPHSHQVESWRSHAIRRCDHRCSCSSRHLRPPTDVLLHPKCQFVRCYHSCRGRPYYTSKHCLPILACVASGSFCILHRCCRHYLLFDREWHLLHRCDKCCHLSVPGSEGERTLLGRGQSSLRRRGPPPRRQVWSRIADAQYILAYRSQRWL